MCVEMRLTVVINVAGVIITPESALGRLINLREHIVELFQYMRASEHEFICVAIDDLDDIIRSIERGTKDDITYCMHGEDCPYHKPPEDDRDEDIHRRRAISRKQTLALRKSKA